MNQPEKLEERKETRSLWNSEYLQKAQKAVTQMLEGSLPPADEDYGPWTTNILTLRLLFEQQDVDLQEIWRQRCSRG